MKDIIQSKLFKVIISLGFSAILLFLILKFSDISINSVFESIKKISIKLFLITFAIGLVANAFRTYRFYILHYKNVNFLQLFLIVNIYLFYTNILPFKTGEISYLYQLKKFKISGITESGGALLFSRIVDLSALLILIMISSFFININNNIVRINFFYLQLIIGLIIILLVTLNICPNYAIKSFIYFFGRIRYNFVKRISDKLYDLLEYSEKVNFRSNYIKLFMISLMIYILVFFNQYLLLTPFNLSLNIFEIIIASSFTLITLFSPVQGVANLGTFEGTFLLGLLFFNVDKNLAMNGILTIHTISLIILIIYFVISKIALYFLMLKRKSIISFKG